MLFAPLCLQLAARVLSEDETVQCQQRWQNERAMFAAELAVMYSSSSAGSSSPPGSSGQEEAEAMDAAPSTSAAALGRTSSAAKSRDSAGSRKRKLSSAGGSDDSDADTAAAGGGSGMAAAAGYVEVCGLELPCRPASAGNGGSGSLPLVHTPAVDRNLEALALGECCAAEGAAGCWLVGLLEGKRKLTWSAAGCMLEMEDVAAAHAAAATRMRLSSSWLPAS